ncbi:immunity 70 family protein [Fimbriiglobus ruber]|uniref:immunity 70 family protein n=1 Tax=Fimbriiglobus ruber TaxID=1908690 RepID=UPI000B4AD9A5|nr:immunity 70 family protein [Fimbriiglobus ruber]
MAVGFRVGSIVDEIGTHDFLHAFFSTISYHLEPNGWGNRFPELMNELYKGKLDSLKADKVLADVAAIRQELKNRRPDEVIWNIENLTAQPPWGNNISPDITDLSNYFVTSTGRDIFDVLEECLKSLKRKSGSLTIESY